MKLRQSTVSASPRIAWLWALLAMSTALPAPAQSTGLSERLPVSGAPVVSVRIVQSQAEPLATAAPSSLLENLAGRNTQAVRQTMLWTLHPSGLGLGIGIEQRGPFRHGRGWQGDELAPESGLLLGVSMVTGQHTALSLQTPLLSSRPAAAGPMLDELRMQQEPARQLRMGLVFNTSNRYADLRRGLRMELSGQTTLSFKPRGGRIGLTLQKTW